MSQALAPGWRHACRKDQRKQDQSRSSRLSPKLANEANNRPEGIRPSRADSRRALLGSAVVPVSGVVVYLADGPAA
jgi:hypothetical protein